jgi:hypothetical protein
MRERTSMAKTYAADELAKRVFLIVMAGIAVEIVAMVFVLLF